MRPSPILLALALAAGCPAESVPGDVVVGTFDFATELLQDNCDVVNQQDPGSFSATVSYDSKTSEAYLTVGATSMAGMLTGDRLSITASANRTLWRPSSDAGCPGAIVERVEGRLIDEGEAHVLGLKCSTDGGLYVPDGGSADARPDVRLICGSISDVLSAQQDPSCTVDPCLVTYSLSGVRQ